MEITLLNKNINILFEIAAMANNIIDDIDIMEIISV